MNEQLQQALTAILNKTMSGVDAGVSFLSGQLPEVIFQLLVWKACMSALSMLACILICLAIYKMNLCQYRVVKKELENGTELIDMPMLMFNLLQFFWMIPVGATFSMDWLKIWVAPKIYLIEYAASLAK